MIIYHADDYGISINASKEILALVQQGKLSGISVIPNISCFADCIDLLLPVMKERPALTVALHLNFFEGHCCADPAKIPLLVDENGYFKCSWMYFFKIRGWKISGVKLMHRVFTSQVVVRELWS